MLTGIGPRDRRRGYHRRARRALCGDGRDFIAGEAFEEPRGIGAISLVLAWLIPLVGLAGLAWFRPRLATPIMIALSGVVVVLASLWFAVYRDAWRVIEDQYGPVRAVAVFV